MRAWIDRGDGIATAVLEDNFATRTVCLEIKEARGRFNIHDIIRTELQLAARRDADIVSAAVTKPAAVITPPPDVLMLPRNRLKGPNYLGM